MTKISAKTLLHMTFCHRCFNSSTIRKTHCCDTCIIMDSKAAAAAAREFVEQEKANEA